MHYLTNLICFWKFFVGKNCLVRPRVLDQKLCKTDNTTYHEQFDTET